MRTKHAPPRKNWWFNATLSMGCVLAAAAAIAADDSASAVASAVADSRTTYAADLEKLAQWCEANGLAEEARKNSPADRSQRSVQALCADAARRSRAAGVAGRRPEKASSSGTARLSKLRHDQRRGAVRDGPAGGPLRPGGLGLRSGDRLRCRPIPITSLPGDCSAIRSSATSGAPPTRCRKLQAGNVWSEKFGWLPKAHLRRYEAGERYCDGRWISAEDDARRHADIRSGWDVETEHYTIRTNHSIEAAVSLGVKLERLYRLWQQLFVRYYASQADVAAMFDGRAKAGPAGQRRHEVWYFRDRDDYNRSLRATMPNIGISIGVYLDDSPPGILLRRRRRRRPHALPRGHAPVVPRVAAGGTPTSAGRATSGSSRGSPCSWNRCGRRTATTCWAGSTTCGCTPPSTA